MDNFNNPQNKRKATGFTNLGRYLQANQGNRLNAGITSGVQQKAQQAEQGIQKGFQGFQQEKEKSTFGTEADKQYTQGILAQPFGLEQQDIDKFKKFREGQYSGPTGLQNVQQLQQGIQQAKDIAQLSGTQTGRRQILDSEIRSPDYTTGKRRLDDLFLNRANPELQQARIKTRGLNSVLNTQEQEAQELARQAAEGNKAFGEQLTKDVGTVREGVINPIAQRLAGAQNIENIKSDIVMLVDELVGEQGKREDPEYFAKRVEDQLKYLNIPKDQLLRLKKDEKGNMADEWTVASNMLGFLDNFGLVNDSNMADIKKMLTRAAENRQHSYRVPLLLMESLKSGYSPTDAGKTKGLNFEGVASFAELERLNTLAKLGGIDESFDPTKERYKAGKFGLDVKRGEAWLDAMLSGRTAEEVFKERNWDYNPDQSGQNFLGDNAFQNLLAKLPNLQLPQSSQQIPSGQTPPIQPSSTGAPSSTNTGGSTLDLNTAGGLASAFGSGNNNSDLSGLGSNLSTAGSVLGALGGSGGSGGMGLGSILGSNAGGIPGISGGTGISDIFSGSGSSSGMPGMPGMGDVSGGLGGLGSSGVGGPDSGLSLAQLPMILKNFKSGEGKDALIGAGSDYLQNNAGSLLSEAGVSYGGAYVAAANKLFGKQDRSKNFMDDPQLAASLAASGVPWPIALAFATPMLLRTEDKYLDKVENITENTGLSKLPMVSSILNQQQDRNANAYRQINSFGNVINPRGGNRGEALTNLLKDGISQPLNDVKNFASNIKEIATSGRQVANVAQDAFKAVSGAIGGLFCLAEGTPIVLSNGSIKNIEDIDLNDDCFLGGKVFAKGVALEDDIYHYNNVLVTGQHAIFENNKWLRVSDSPNAFKTDLKDIKVYPVANENHLLISANGVIFADHQETEEGSALTDDQRIEVLNKQIERNKDLSLFQSKLSEIIEVA